jgi:hypothetical protein
MWQVKELSKKMENGKWKTENEKTGLIFSIFRFPFSIFSKY